MMAKTSLKEVLQQFSLTQEELDKPCTFEQCSEIASKMVKWEPVAPFIGLDESDIVAIQRDNKDYDSQRSSALNTWREKYGSRATFLKLARAFEKKELFDHVEMVCKVFKVRLSYLATPGNEHLSFFGYFSSKEPLPRMGMRSTN